MNIRERNWMQDEKYTKNFSRKIVKGRDDFRKLDVNGRIILKWNLNKQCV
jgi:hypothetical protein